MRNCALLPRTADLARTVQTHNGLELKLNSDNFYMEGMDTSEIGFGISSVKKGINLHAFHVWTLFK